MFTGMMEPTNATYTISYGDSGREELLIWNTPEMVIENLCNSSDVLPFFIRVKNRATDEIFMEKVSHESWLTFTTSKDIKTHDVF